MSRACAAFCLLVVFSPAILAQEPSDRGWYGGLTIGRSKSTEFCSPQVDCDQTDLAGRAFLGFQFRRWFGLELGYSHLGSLSTTYGQSPQREYAADLTPAFTLAFDAFSVQGRIGLYGNDHGVGPTLALGAGYRLGAQLGLRVEWQHFYDASILSGFEASLISLGARWRF